MNQKAYVEILKNRDLLLRTTERPLIAQMRGEDLLSFLLRCLTEVNALGLELEPFPGFTDANLPLVLNDEYLLINVGVKHHRVSNLSMGWILYVNVDGKEAYHLTKNEDDLYVIEAYDDYDDYPQIYARDASAEKAVRTLEQVLLRNRLRRTLTDA